MVIGVAAWELQIFGAQSLKEKRSVVKSLKDRLRERFNVAVAETAHHDVWQRAEIAVSTVSTDRRHAESVIESVDRFMAGDGRARIVDSYRIFY